MTFKLCKTEQVDNLKVERAFQNLIYGFENLEKGHDLDERQKDAFHKVGSMLENEDPLEVYCDHSDIMKKIGGYSHEVEARLIHILRGGGLENMERDDRDSCVKGFECIANVYYLRAQGIR